MPDIPDLSIYIVCCCILCGTSGTGRSTAVSYTHLDVYKRQHVFCAGYRADEFEELLQYADHIVFNSPSQLLRFGARAKEVGKSVGLRINPECSTQEGHDIYDPVSYTHLRRTATSEQIREGRDDHDDGKTKS